MEPIRSFRDLEGASHRAAARQHALRECDGTAREVSLDQFIDRALVERLTC